MTPTTLLWIEANIARASDNGITIKGNEYCAVSVINTLQFIAAQLGLDFKEPTYIEMVEHLTATGRASEVQYMMEVY